MLALCSVLALAIWASLWLLPWQPQRTRERFEPTSSPTHPSDLSDLCVLIPARNEAERLPETLAALARQGHGLKVLVVNDQSTDATAAVVARAAREMSRAAHSPDFPLNVTLISGEALPEGWGGKLWALQQGLAEVDRETVLLLDADISLAPAVLPSLLAAARARGAQLFSLMATLRTDSVWERLLVPPFIFFFKLIYPFACANDRNSRIAAAAGGVILIDTQALRAIGGFNSIRGALIDDCSLAAEVKRAGYSTWLGLSRSVSSTRAYRNLDGFWRMVSRTAFTQLKYSLSLLLLASLAMVVLFVAPLAALLIGPLSSVGLLGFAAWLAMSAAYLPIVVFYRLPVLWTLTLPFAAMLFLAMTWDSAIAYWRGTRARWKDRAYQSPRS
jgi:hopene-associated glycosyltransferase HpnB